MTARELAQRFDNRIKPRTIRKYVAEGILPPPKGRGPAASYDPVCVGLLTQLFYARDYLSASLADLAERRQLTGQFLPDPDGRQPPVMARGAV